MLAPARIPKDFHAWNKREGAPFGKPLTAERWLKRLLPATTLLKLRGPFSTQPNNTIRRFEYPWAFHATPLGTGLRVLEIGGGLSGFQFILAREGCEVVNVDPGLEARGVDWRCGQEGIAQLNRAFGTHVELRNTVVQEANLSDASFDRAFSISVLEHLPDDEIIDVMNHIYRALRPGGLFIVTVDLFLELAPFTHRQENRWGKNINVRSLVDATRMKLVQGDPQYLYGVDAFDPERVQSNLADFMIGYYPALAQCLVLEKPLDDAD